MAASGKNCRYSTNRQVVIDADTRLVVAVGRPLPGNRNDCGAWEDSGAKAAVGTTPTVIADDGHRDTGLTIRSTAGTRTKNCRPGRKTTTPPTARSGPASSTPSPT